MTKTVYIETYGCQMNVSDTELILGVLHKRGYSEVGTAEDADLILVNTCAIRDNAEQRVIGRLGELKRHKRDGDVLGVVGCMAQRLGSKLLERATHVDLVAGPDGYRSLGDLAEKARGDGSAIDVEFKDWEHYEDVTPARNDRVGAFVTVQRGCDHRCTFCIVPYTRGPERSRRLEEVVNEVRQLATEGTSEVTLLGQTVNSYDDGQHDFADLLRAVGRVDGIRRLRFTSPHPNDFSDAVIEAMASVPEVCEHVHLPVQSGSSRVLKRMLRRYDRDAFLRCVERLRNKIPELAISTDIIVGFPGETDDDFEETLSLVREVEFDDAFMFRYSVRDGTPAQKLKERVPAEVAGERLQRLIELVRATACGRNVRLVGRTFEVLYEREAKRGGLLQGRSRSNKVILVERDISSIGSFETVRITGTTGSTFTGVPTTDRRHLAVVC